MEQHQRLALRLQERMGRPVSGAPLADLVYLADYLHYQHYGSTITGFRYTRSDDGPEAVSEPAADASLREPSSPYGVGRLNARVEHVLESVVVVYGELTPQEVNAAVRETSAYERARPSEQIEMKQTAPVVYGAQGGWEAHLREVAEGGFWTLEELQEEYGEEHR